MPELWPAGVNQMVEKNSWNEKAISNVIKTQSESGIEKRRATFTKKLHIVTVALILKSAEKELFDQWHSTTLGNGVKSFYFRHPYRQIDVIYTFEDEPSSVYFGHDEQRVSFSMKESLI